MIFPRSRSGSERCFSIGAFVKIPRTWRLLHPENFARCINGENVDLRASLFETSADGWTTGNGSGAVGFTSGSWPEGVAFATQNANDCWWKGPVLTPGYTGFSDGCVNVKVYPQNGTTANHDMKVYYTTTVQNWFSESYSSPTVTYAKQNAYISLNFDVNGPNFGNRTITQLRLDFDAVNHGNTWIVDRIIPQSRPNGVFDADVQGWMAGNFGVASPIGWNGTSCPACWRWIRMATAVTSTVRPSISGERPTMKWKCGLHPECRVEFAQHAFLLENVA
jgi:hypothetical protein